MDKAAVSFGQLKLITDLYGDRARHVFNEQAPAIAESLHAQVYEVFETEGFGEWPGFAWQRTGVYGPAQKPSTKGKRGRRWRGTPKLLQDTGNLIGSMTPDWNDGLVEVYSNVPYVRYHASPEPRHVIPLRDPFDIDSEAFEGDVADMILLRMYRDADRDLAAE